MWEPQWPSLTSRHDVVRLDLRGFGDSTARPVGPLSAPGDVLAVLDAEGIECCHLVGASYGAGVAVEVALTRPAAVASLLLAAPGGSLIPEATDDLRAFAEEENAALGDDAFHVWSARVDSLLTLEDVIDSLDAALGEDERAFFTHALDQHTRRSWRDPRARSQARYSLAVLIDPSEPHPPSNQATLRHLAKVAQKFSIEIEPITKGDLDRLAEYDALFIRATTSIDNFTYRFARRAEQEGMPVIDDPQSMIRCTNKVYLAERLTAAGVPTPRTVVVQGVKQAPALGQELGWPVVLKIPDGSFSRGVFKCDDLDSLTARLKELLDDSDLVIAQEFVPTAFDWRIGVLAGEPLFACQYHMVKKHWQIMKYKDGKTVGEGRFTTMPLDRVPHGVVETAVKAARLMGQGLYGVDLKQTENGLFVIEVNDNPDLNHGIEDAEEKDALWEKLVKWFWDRLEA